MRPLTIATLVACSACSGGSTLGAGTFPAEPLSVLTSDAGKLHVELRTSPDQPPTTGLESVELVVTNPASSAPVNGLSIAMTPWMPAHGHGTSATPILESKGSGHYVFTNVSLFMPGEWQLRTQFSGSVTDTCEPIVDVQ